MFYRRRSTGPLVHGDSPLERLVRTMGLFAVFALAAWGFWHVNERRLAQYSEEDAIHDPGGLLSESDRRLVMDFREALQDRYGLHLRLSVGPGAAAKAKGVDAKTLFLGLDPEASQALLVLPPLLRKGLGDEFAQYLENEHFGPYFEAQDWPQGLRAALVLLWNRLESMSGNPAPAPAGGGQ